MNRTPVTGSYGLAHPRIQRYGYGGDLDAGSPATGSCGLAHPRIGFSDYDAFHRGFVARDTWTGNLDAPDYMPQGSMVAGINIGKPGGRASIAHRDHDTGYRPLGACHDGQKEV